MDRRRHGLVLIVSLFLVSACAGLGAITQSTGAWAASNLPARHHPTPTPAPTPPPPPPTPRPTPPPPPPTPTPAPPPTPTFAPSAAPPPGPSAETPAAKLPATVPVANGDQAGLSSLPFTGPASGEAQAVAIGPSAAAAATEAVPNDTQTLFWSIALIAMAIPGFLLMTLIATVLIRR